MVLDSIQSLKTSFNRALSTLVVSRSLTRFWQPLLISLKIQVKTDTKLRKKAELCYTVCTYAPVCLKEQWEDNGSNFLKDLRKGKPVTVIRKHILKA